MSRRESLPEVVGAIHVRTVVCVRESVSVETDVFRGRIVDFEIFIVTGTFSVLGEVKISTGRNGCWFHRRDGEVDQTRGCEITIMITLNGDRPLVEVIDLNILRRGVPSGGESYAGSVL